MLPGPSQNLFSLLQLVFFQARVTDICWGSGGNLQIAGLGGPGAPTRIVGNLVEQWASVSTFFH
jgi:hypothetical protein